MKSIKITFRTEILKHYNIIIKAFVNFAFAFFCFIFVLFNYYLYIATMKRKFKYNKKNYWLMPIMSPCGLFLTYKRIYYYPSF